LEFTRHPLTGEVAHILRASSRGHHPPTLDGHSFVYRDLKELWVSVDGEHVVLTHDKEDGWQYWHKPPEDEGGWALVSVHPYRGEAQAAADLNHGPPPLAAGTYFLAWHPGGRTIRVLCVSPDAAETLTAIFTKLGYDTSIEEVN
jgi:hypothetical protein